MIYLIYLYYFEYSVFVNRFSFNKFAFLPPKSQQILSFDIFSLKCYTFTAILKKLHLHKFQQRRTMISNTMFITYTAMCFASLQAITLVIIILKHNDSGKSKLMTAMLRFVVVSAILGLYYYITYYRELILGEFAAGIFLRALDSIVFYAMGFSWINLMDAIIDSPHPKMQIWRKLTTPVFSFLMAFSAVIYIFLLDEYYTTDAFWKEVVVLLSEVVLAITIVVFTLAYLILGFRELVDAASRKYVITISIFVCFNNLWNNIVVVFVFLRAISVSALCSNLYAVTSVLLLITNLLTILYVYKKDFSPVYFGDKKNSSRKLSEEEVLNLVAESHRLTERERDVMILAYQGLSNPDIAEKLFISRHTVKRHMHNIFEKLDVSTRMELVHLIQSQTNLEKQL